MVTFCCFGILDKCRFHVCLFDQPIKMDLSGWLLLASVIIGSLFVLLGFFLWWRNHTNTGQTEIQPFVTNWSAPGPGPDTSRNVCKTYTFPGSFVSSTFVPGNPSFDLVEGLNPSNIIPQCLDYDQLIASQITRKCERGNCLTENGVVVGPNFEETLYTNSVCSSVGPCQGQLALLVPNYFTGDKCVDSNGSTQVCDPTNENQLFRISRTNIGVNPNGKNQINNDGLIGRIYDRDNQTCLRASNNLQTISVDLSQYSGCSGSTSITGFGLEFGPCGAQVPNGLYPGYVWGFVPSTSYCPDIGGCHSGVTYSVPPQIVYLASLDFSSYPTTGFYQGLQGSNAVIKWLIDQNATSIQYGGQGSPVLGPFQILQLVLGVPISPCGTYPSVIQYIDVSIYNSTVSKQVCYVGVVDQNCIPL